MGSRRSAAVGLRVSLLRLEGCSVNVAKDKPLFTNVLFCASLLARRFGNHDCWDPGGSSRCFWERHSRILVCRHDISLDDER
jgi:hypothetical protein